MVQCQNVPKVGFDVARMCQAVCFVVPNLVKNFDFENDGTKPIILSAEEMILTFDNCYS